MNELDNIPAAIEAIRRGEVIIVVDDEDRENEGDFLVAARHATPEVVNFMATQKQLKWSVKVERFMSSSLPNAYLKKLNIKVKRLVWS